MDKLMGLFDKYIEDLREFVRENVKELVTS